MVLQVVAEDEDHVPGTDFCQQPEGTRQSVASYSATAVASPLTYEISGAWVSAETAPFSIDSNGVVTVTGNVDLDADVKAPNDKFPVTITIRDGNTAFQPACSSGSFDPCCYKETNLQLIIQIRDKNDQKPIFEETEDATFSVGSTGGATYTKAGVSELNAKTSDGLLTVKAVDADTGDAPTYRLVASLLPANALDYQLFNIAADGKITAARTLKYHTQPEYRFRVEALDPEEASKATYADVALLLIDANDNAPTIVSAVSGGLHTLYENSLACCRQAAASSLCAILTKLGPSTFKHAPSRRPPRPTISSLSASLLLHLGCQPVPSGKQPLAATSRWFSGLTRKLFRSTDRSLSRL
jgi:hypothetical protein